jgi:ribokinase
MAGRVIVVGSVNVDLVVTVERLPAPGETVTGGQYERHPGGKGGNQAVAAARLGASVAFVGAVGSDVFGEEARAALAAEGIDLTGLIRIDGEATGVALIIVDKGGENVIAVAGGANGVLTSVQVRAAFKKLAPTAGDVVLVGHEIRTGAAHEALRLGRIAKAITIFNPAPATDVPRTTIELADVLTPNAGEAAILADAVGVAARPAAVARRILGPASGARSILVSLGAEGAILVGPQRAIKLRAPAPVVVDTVGAGDTLNGALAAGLAAGLSLEVAARRAVMAAGLAVTKAGARAGMPTAAELDAADPG